MRALLVVAADKIGAMPDIEERAEAPGNSSSAATPPTGFAALWPLVDAVHCITLSTRPERRTALEPELVAVGLSDRATFLVQAPDVAEGARGTHLLVYELIDPPCKQLQLVLRFHSSNYKISKT